MFDHPKRKVGANGQEEARQSKIYSLKEQEEKLASRFHCHICGVSSKKPARYTHEVIYVGDWGFIGYNTVDDGPNWDEPGDLAKCIICHEWACAKHLNEGICTKCAGNL